MRRNARSTEIASGGVRGARWSLVWGRYSECDSSYILMCMITTTARLGDEPLKESTSAACGALRGSSRETENTNDSQESPRSSNLLPTSLTGLAKDEATAETRHGRAAFPALSTIPSPKKQRIQVIVRIRPIEDKAGRTTTVLADGRTLCLTPTPKGAKVKLDQGRLRESRKELEATFDRVLGETADQKEVYDQVKACVRLPFAGVNSCIFAYGQTGSGKTYSMMGDTPQLVTEKVGTTTNHGGLSSSCEPHSENTGRREAVGADEAEKFTTGSTSNDGKSGAEVAGSTAGVIPRAVDDIFRIVREGGVRDKETTTPLLSTSGQYSFRQPAKGPDPPPAETVPSPTAACGSGSESAPNASAPGTSHSLRSSRSSSSEESSLTQVPSAAHWPLGEPMVYVPRAQIPRDGAFSPARQCVQPHDHTGKCDAVGTEEDGGSDETRRACQEERGETITTIKYSVQCSYVQVYNGRVYDLLSPHASQHRPVPVLASARRVTTTGSIIEEPAQNVGGNSYASTTAVAGKRRRSPSFARRESRSGSRLVGLSNHAVDSPEQVMELLRQGARNRHVRSTEMNTHSSRSHTIVQFTISSTPGETATASHLPSGRESIDTPTASRQKTRQLYPVDDDEGDNNADEEQAGAETRSDREIYLGASNNASSGGKSGLHQLVATRAKLSLVDLAGSEKGRVGGPGDTEKRESLSRAGPQPTQGEDDGEAQERERSRINSSLSALSNCISCLGEARRTHIPFRDNPLTRLLQDSLVGGKTVVIATIRPSVDAQAESISTLNFAARCMRVVARHRVNEVVSDSLLLERARRQISSLRRRLVEAEAAAAIASSLAPFHRPHPLEEVEPPPASAETPPSPPPPPPTLASEMNAVVLATPETRSPSSGGNESNGSGFIERDETARSSGGRRREKFASHVAAPRGERTQEHPAGEKLIGSLGNTGASGGDISLTMEAIRRRRRCASTTEQAPVLAFKGEAESPSPRPLRAGEGVLDGDVNSGQPRSSPSPSLSGAGEVKREGGTQTRTLFKARRGRDIVVRDKIATAVAAANAAAAAATAVASAISAAGGGRSKLAPPVIMPATDPIPPAAAVRHGSSRGGARPQLRKKPAGGSRMTKAAARRPTFRPSCSNPSDRPAPPPARSAQDPAAAALTAGRRRAADERGVATQALIERFSSREEELLRELEAWKARCESFEKKEPTPRPRGTGGGGRAALAGRRGGGGETGEQREQESPTRVETGPTATRAMAPAPRTAQPKGPLHAISRADPAVGVAEEEAPDASQAAADSHRLARGGVGRVSAPISVVPEQGRDVDPQRWASIEVLERCAGGWWYRRLPDVPRESCRKEAEHNPLDGRRGLRPGAGNPRAVDNRAVGPAAEAVGLERVAQDGREEIHGTCRPEGVSPAEKEVSVARAGSRATEYVASTGNGETYGGRANTLTPVAVEREARPPQDKGAEMMQVGERCPPQSSKPEESKIGLDGEGRGAHGSDGNARSAKPVLPKPGAGGAAVDPAWTRTSICGTDRSPRSPQGIPAQLDESETRRKGNAEQDTAAGSLSLEKRSSAAEAPCEVDSTPSLSLSLRLPLSSDRFRDTGLANPTQLGGQGSTRHDLELCTLCGPGHSVSLRLSDERSSAPLFPERVRGDPCDRHLLLDCILCKMLPPALCGDALSPAPYGRTTPHRHGLGRSASLPALGSTTPSRGGGRGNGGADSGVGVDMAGVVPVAATKTEFDKVGSPSTYRCERHDLVGCFLCGSRVKSPTAPKRGDSADTRRTDVGPAVSPAPRLVLPPPTSHSDGRQTSGASPAGVFMDQPLRGSKGLALGAGSAGTGIDPVVGGDQGGNSGGVSKRAGPELFERSILVETPSHPADTARTTANDAAAAPTEAKAWDEPLGSGVADGDADFRDLGGRLPSSSQLTPFRGGSKRRNNDDSSENTENRSLAGGGTIGAGGGSVGINHTGHDDGKPTAGGTPSVKTSVDGGIRNRRPHRSRGGTPRRRRVPWKPPTDTWKHTSQQVPCSSSRSKRSLKVSSDNSESRSVVRGRALANTVVSATRAREKLCDDDLAARAITAALTVLHS